MISDREKRKYQEYGKQVVRQIAAATAMINSSDDEIFDTFAAAFSTQNVVVINLTILLLTNGVDEETIKLSLYNIIRETMFSLSDLSDERADICDTIVYKTVIGVIENAKEILSIRVGQEDTLCKYLM